jgi:hypothetical protein
MVFFINHKIIFLIVKLDKKLGSQKYLIEKIVH